MVEIKYVEDLRSINGGTDLSGSLINAFTSGIRTIMDVGRSLGTAIRRIISGNLCKL